MTTQKISKKVKIVTSCLKNFFFFGIIENKYQNVLVTHGLATVIPDKRLATVAEHELDSTILSDRFDYIALGHYHRQSPITDNAWYSGSTEYLTYGEIADEKGGLIVDPGRHEVPSCVG